MNSHLISHLSSLSKLYGAKPWFARCREFCPVFVDKVSSLWNPGISLVYIIQLLIINVHVSLARVYLDYLVNKICAMHDK